MLLQSCSFGASTPEVRKQPPLAGVILQSPIESAIRVVSNALSYLPLDIFRNYAKIPYIDCPVLVIHGTDDEVVPFQHGLTLYERAKNPWRLLKIENGLHNNLETDFGELILRTIAQFIESIQSAASERYE